MLNHAMCGQEGVENCNKFVEVYGLRSLFPAFMKPPKKSKKADTSEFEHEEHVCSIIGSLFSNTQPAYQERLVSKFVENDCEKVDRLMELHFKYLRRVRNVEEQIRREKRMAVSVDTDDTDEDQFIRRLDAGLFTLQQVDYIIAELCTTADVGVVAGRIDTLLNQHGDSLQTVKETLLEYAAGLGEGSDANEPITKQKQRLNTLASKL